MEELKYLGDELEIHISRKGVQFFKLVYDKETNTFYNYGVVHRFMTKRRQRLMTHALLSNFIPDTGLRSFGHKEKKPFVRPRKQPKLIFEKEVV